MNDVMLDALNMMSKEQRLRSLIRICEQINLGNLPKGCVSAQKTNSRKGRRREDGKCPQCDAPAMPGRRHCRDHHEGSQMKHFLLRRKRKLNGLCTVCGAPRPKNRTTCVECRKDIHARRKVKMEERRQLGLCLDCGNAAHEGKQYCFEHLIRYRDKSRERRERDRADSEGSVERVPGAA